MRSMAKKSKRKSSRRKPKPSAQAPTRTVHAELASCNPDGLLLVLVDTPRGKR